MPRLSERNKGIQLNSYLVIDIGIIIFKAIVHFECNDSRIKFENDDNFISLVHKL